MLPKRWITIIDETQWRFSSRKAAVAVAVVDQAAVAVVDQAAVAAAAAEQGCHAIYIMCLSCHLYCVFVMPSILCVCHAIYIMCSY